MHAGAFHSLVQIDAAPFLLAFGRSNSAITATKSAEAENSEAALNSAPISFTSSSVSCIATPAPLTWPSLLGLEGGEVFPALQSLAVAGEWNWGIRMEDSSNRNSL